MTLGKEKKDAPLPEIATVDPDNLIHLSASLKQDQVREGVF